MIKHIVMFQFKEEQKEQNLLKVKAMLEALPQHIEPLRQMEVGINITPSERAFDLVLTSVFDDLAGLEIYRNHEAHLKVVAFIKQVTTISKVVDYAL